MNEGARSLRQSTDDVALKGYASLAEEITEVKDVSDVFIGTSSGTTAQALIQYFSKNKLPIHVHIVQTSSCHPMSGDFESYDGPNEPSIADAIVDQVAQRKAMLVPLLKKNSGSGWTVTNEQIEGAQTMSWTHAELEISTNSALSVAGAMQAAAIGHEMKGAVVCIIGGE